MGQATTSRCLRRLIYSVTSAICSDTLKQMAGNASVITSRKTGSHGTHGTHGTHGIHGTHGTHGVGEANGGQSGKGIFGAHGSQKGSAPGVDVDRIPNLGWLQRGVPASFARAVERDWLRREDIRQIIPDRTLERRIANGEDLKIEEADGLARLMRVVSLARRAFEDEGLADEWLRTPNPALNDLIPIQMARTDLGGREVEAVLMRLEQGVFS
jgi:putative toxin-antitoxin system antitoxin component (TIGR02293 family)